jgi:hypothetical protein
MYPERQPTTLYLPPHFRHREDSGQVDREYFDVSQPSTHLYLFISNGHLRPVSSALQEARVYPISPQDGAARQSALAMPVFKKKANAAMLVPVR